MSTADDVPAGWLAVVCCGKVEGPGLAGLTWLERWPACILGDRQ